MRKEIIRREVVKYKLQGKTYREIIDLVWQRFEWRITKRTLINWMKRFDETDWDFRDKSQRPNTIHFKFNSEQKLVVVGLRKSYGYSSQKLRIKLQEKGIFMSESYVKQIIKLNNLSRGNKMEGIKLKWVRFERDNPNSMWQTDGTETEDGWILPIIDDCSRYCLAVKELKNMTTANVIALLEEAILMHGKPREILTDNGPEFGGKSTDSEFDKWCDKRGIKHIRSGVHKPTTLGKISAIQQTIMRELPYCNNDLELWRYRYNCERPHESLRGLTPRTIYFQYKRHKKHYEL